MEDKKLTPQESMDLISDMISTTRRRFSIKDSNILILWGTVLTIIPLAIALLTTAIHTSKWNLLWLLLIPTGIYNVYASRKYRIHEPISYTDQISANIWKGTWCIAVITAVICAIFTYATDNSTVWMAMFFFAFLIIGMATMSEGFVIRERTLAFGGICGVIVGMIFFGCYISKIMISAIPGYLLMTATYAIMFLLPGIVIRNKIKNNRQ